MIRMPEYTDGYFELCEISEVKENDYPVEIIKKTGMKIWYREISVFDRMRYEVEQGNKEITMKIRIPRYKGIDSKCDFLISLPLEGIPLRGEMSAKQTKGFASPLKEKVSRSDG